MSAHLGSVSLHLDAQMSFRDILLSRSEKYTSFCGRFLFEISCRPRISDAGTPYDFCHKVKCSFVPLSHHSRINNVTKTPSGEIPSIHYSDVIMGAMATQITSLTMVHSTVYSGADKKKPSKLRVTGLCAGISPVTGEFPAQMASNADNVSIWWRHHGQTHLPICGWAWFHCRDSTAHGQVYCCN